MMCLNGCRERLASCLDCKSTQTEFDSQGNHQIQQASVARLAEQETFNLLGVGSTPSRGTKFIAGGGLVIHGSLISFYNLVRFQDVATNLMGI